MALSEDVKSKWYQALFEEDCMAVMKQLAAYPGLLKKGWESEPSRQVEGRKRREWTGRTKSVWKGRTALHVGVSRGCVKLVMQVLGLCNLEGFDVVNQEYQKSLKLLEYSSVSNFVTNSGLSCHECSGELNGRDRWTTVQPQYSLSVKPQYNLCPDCYEKQGNEKDFIKIKFGWREPPIMATNISPKSSCDREAIEGTPGQPPDSSPDDAIEQGDPQRGREHAQAVGKVNSLSPGPAARKLQMPVSTIVRKNRPDESEEQASGVSVSDQDVTNLLVFQDGECGLRVEATAALHGNPVIILLLEYAIQANERGSMGIGNEAADTLADLLNASTNERELLRRTIIEGIGANMHYYLDWYNGHRDFNFLPPEEYLFHFIFAGSLTPNREVASQLWRAVRSKRARSGKELWRFLLEYRDGQGRTPFHVAMEHFNEMFFVESIENPSTDDREVVVCAMTTCDGVGRTPMYRAAAIGLQKTVEILLKYACNYKEVETTCIAKWRTDGIPNGPNVLGTYFNLDYNAVSRVNDFPLAHQLPQSPVYAAITHGNVDCAKLLIKKWRELEQGDMTFRSIDEKLIDIFRNDNTTRRTYKTKWQQEYSAWIEWDIVEFACLAGAPIQIVGFLLDTFKYDMKNTQKPSNPHDLYAPNKTEEAVTLKHLWHPLHIVASLGKYDMLKYFLDDRKCNPFLEDYDGNSALHHAMKVTEPEFKTHMMDYVDAQHASLASDRASRWGRKWVTDDKSLAERQECINLLLHVGCEVFKANKRNQLPYPAGSLNDTKLLSWWHGKQEKEFNAAQTNLNFATNAITVTAALVATASYVGPLQPPMGYDANQIQYENLWVSTFIVCDTLSFYLAIFSITVSLIPALPMPRQAMLEELQRTRGMVILAVGILFPSICFVFVAFASSSISVMSANITSQVGGVFTIVSTLLGMILCLLGFALFFIRLLAFVYPHENSIIRHLYHFSNYLWISLGKKGT